MKPTDFESSPAASPTDAEPRKKRGPNIKLSTERMAAFMARYPHVSNEQLAAEFGVTVGFCKNRAKRFGLSKSAARVTEYRNENQAQRMDRSPIIGALLAHIDSRRSQGATLASAVESTGRHEGGVWNALQRLVETGRAVRVDGKPLTYFTNPVHAREFIVARDRESIAAAQATQARKRSEEAAQRSEQAMRKVRAKEGGKATAFKLQEAITPAGVKVTRVLTAPVDLRYQCIPGADVPRLFSIVPPGRDPMTGREWGRAA